MNIRMKPVFTENTFGSVLSDAYSGYLDSHCMINLNMNANKMAIIISAQACPNLAPQVSNKK